MSDFSIKKLKETGFSYQDIVELLHLAFEERWRQGLHFSCAKMTAEEYEADTKVCEVFIAVDQETGQLLGTASIRIYRKPDKPVYGLFEYLAVHPDASRRGIATELLHFCIDYSIHESAAYVMSDTATEAYSSVKFHFRNGFRLVDIVSYPQTNYLSFVFKRNSNESSPSKLKWKCRYLLARTKLTLLYKKDGSPTAIAKLIR